METRMEAKKYVYAAVGAPVALARSTQSRLERLRSELGERRRASWEDVQRQVAAWAEEGERLIERLTDAKAIDELAAKVDFDQMQGQVTRLRDQLEEMLETWRANFRPHRQSPETGEEEARAAGNHESGESEAAEPDTGEAASEEGAAGKSAGSKSPSAKKPATKKTTAAKPATKAS